ncbi:hypothetical protein [Streptomyces crystallinus]|uniref:Uncharacterized protein n=1 Tax=Streptomyces crystallinus TaxID=68191 RepID=A0ABP3RT29_9ACTN
MSDSTSAARLVTAQPDDTATPDMALRERHATRARKALDRAAATCRYAGIAEHDAKSVPRDPAEKAANALRLAAQVLAALPESPLDPAADARCARNAAAAAAVAAQVARDEEETSDLSAAAYRAALVASQVAMEAAGREGLGRSEGLNAKADEAEERATLAAQAAGWI